MLNASQPWRRASLSLAFIALLLIPCRADAQESSRHVMARLTISSTADVASSTTFDITATFSQEGPVGSVSVCNDGTFQSTGY